MVMMVMTIKIHPIYYILTFAIFIITIAILNKTIMNNELNVSFNDWAINIEKSKITDQLRNKKEYIRKYNIKSIKVNKTRTSLEQWN